MAAAATGDAHRRRHVRHQLRLDQCAHEFGATPWWHGGGSLEWELELDRADQRANVQQLQAWGYAAEWIDRKQVQELEADISPAVIGDVKRCVT